MNKQGCRFYVLIFFNLLVLSSYAQKFYIQAGIGHNIGLFPNKIAVNYWEPYYTWGPVLTNYNYGEGSYGGGTSINISAGYNFNKYISTEIGISRNYSGYYSWDTSWTELLSKYLFYFGDSVYGTASRGKALSATQTRIIPVVKFQLHSKIVSPFIKIGPVIRIGGNIRSIYYWSDPQSDDGGSYTTYYKGGFSIGCFIGLGGEISLGNKFGLVAQESLIIQNWAPTKQVDNPTIKLASYSHSFSSWGFNMGIKYYFGGKNEVKDSVFHPCFLSGVGINYSSSTIEPDEISGIGIKGPAFSYTFSKHELSFGLLYCENLEKSIKLIGIQTYYKFYPFGDFRLLNVYFEDYFIHMHYFTNDYYSNSKIGWLLYGDYLCLGLKINIINKFGLFVEDGPGIQKRESGALNYARVSQRPMLRLGLEFKFKK